MEKNKEIYAECSKCGKLIKGLNELKKHIENRCNDPNVFYIEKKRHKPSEDQLIADLRIIKEEFEDKFFDYFAFHALTCL